MLRDALDSLAPGHDFNRRDFVRASVGSGFAAAVLPVMAQRVVKTDAGGLLVGEVTIPVAAFKLPAYRAAPLGQPNAPVVLVISETFGVQEYIADVAQRLAKAGYFAIAPELFVRQGDADSCGESVEIAKRVSEVVNQVPDAQVMGDLDAAVAWARGPGRGHGQTGDHRLLPGRPHHLAVCGAQPGGQGRRGLLWPAGGCAVSVDAGPPAGVGRADEGRACRRLGGRQAVRDRGLPGHAACLPCRLPAQLSPGRRRGWLAPLPGLVQGPGRGVILAQPGAARRVHRRGLFSEAVDR